MQYLQPKFTIPPPEKVTCCEACVYGIGEHAEWCETQMPDRIPNYMVQFFIDAFHA